MTRCINPIHKEQYSGKSIRSSKIVFVSDFFPSSSIDTGINSIINHGVERGFSISEVNDSDYDFNEVSSANLLVLGSIDLLSEKAYLHILDLIKEKQVPYITYFHDYHPCIFKNNTNLSTYSHILSSANPFDKSNQEKIHFTIAYFHAQD